MNSWENVFSNLLLGDGDPEVSSWECGTPLCFQEIKWGRVQQRAVWREVISRGGGDHGKPATVHKPGTLIVSGGLQHFLEERWEGILQNTHARKQATLQISLSNKQSPMGSGSPGRLGEPLTRSLALP